MTKIIFFDPDALEKNENTTDKREVYIDRHEIVKLSIEMGNPEAWKIFNDLSTIALPILPLGYQWVRANKKYSIIREKTTQEHTLTLILYGPNQAGQINYIFQVDQKTTFSFAHTKADVEPERHYPMTGEDFRVAGCDYSGHKYSSHVRGHLIDHQDTITVGNRQYWSTYDPRNYVPEPPEYEWGLGIRRLAVGKIRKNKGAYAQFSCYPDKPLITINGTPVPKDAYFFSYKTTANGYQPTEVYYIEWDESLKRPKGTKVLDHASANLTTALEAAPIVTPYIPNSPDRAHRAQAREATIRANKISSGEIKARSPSRDGLLAHASSGDQEFETATRKLRVGLFAESVEQRYLSLEYTLQALNHGEDLIEIDKKTPVFSKEETKDMDNSRIFKKASDNYKKFDVEDMQDRFRQLKST